MSSKSMINKKIDFNLLYDEAFNAITGFYRNLTENISDTITNTSLHEFTLKVVSILIGEFNLSQSNVINDFISEIERMKDENMQDIPTFHIRFAIEEGSWILLLRKKYPPLVANIFDRIILLEDSLWVTGKGITEDFAYYLLEMEQLASNYVYSLIRLWKKEHVNSSSEDIVTRIIASVYKVNSPQAKGLLEGGIRVLRSKMSDFIKLKKFDSYSTRIHEAKQILSRLENDLSTNRLSDESFAFITMLTIFQKQIMVHQQKSIKKKQKYLNKADNKSEIASQLNWSRFNPEKTDHVKKIKEIILNLLYEQPEEKPLDAAVYLLDKILNGLEVKKHRKKEMIEIFEETITSRIDSGAELLDQITKTVQLIEILLPKTVIKLKYDKRYFESSGFDEQEVMTEDIWDSFEDNIKRARRVFEDPQAYKIIYTLIESIISFLIDKHIPSERTYGLILKQFKNRFTQYNEKIDLLISEVDTMVKIPAKSIQRVKEREIMEYMIDSIFKIIRAKKS